MTSIIKSYFNRRILAVLLLSFSSALPLAMVAGTLQAWLATEKVDIATIGLFSLVGLPYTWKFLWSPFFDRFTTKKFLGPRRGWILILQLTLFAALVGMGTINAVSQTKMLALAAVIVAFFSASQDIVIDAYRAEVLRPDERGSGAGVTNLGARLALLLSGAGALIMSDHLPWNTVYFVMACLLGVGVLGTLIAPEPEKAIIHPTSLKDAVIDPFLEFFKRKDAWAMLFFVVLYKFSDAFSVSLATPFLLNVGFTKTQIGIAFKGVGMASTIVGALAGGAIIARIGLVRSLWVFGVLQALSNFGFIILTYVGPQFSALLSVMAVDNVCGGLGTAAFLAFLMASCNVRYTATQYALLSSVMAIARVFVGAPAGFVVKAYGWPTFFVISIILAIPGLALLHKFAPWGSSDKNIAEVSG
ncbi:MAG: AmpG family muropeptide MFS transporter [Deltaproteobacteria bacterium CG11_big_fil_rev_8_21_14_0_20_47_16]|nr:MAG: AmpG family muropeptide MFS transporter [Deltaproteobacteria bacterium CG11_big_fil_rev_8_21_14_0_20_47_16]